MSKVNLLKAGTYFSFKTSPKGLNPKNFRYVADANECAATKMDEFVRGVDIEKAAADSVKKAKKITKADQERFHAYMQMKRMEISLSQAEIIELMKYEGDELIKHSIDLFAGKMKIPKSLIPKVMPINLNEETFMAYDCIQNIIITNPNAKIKSKSEFIGCVAHELRHMVQNLDIMRTDGLGEKAISRYAKKYAKAQVRNVVQIVKRYSVEDYKKLNSNPQAIAEFEYLKNLMKNNPVEFKNNNIQLYTDFENNILQILNAFRQNVIEEMGTLKANSEQGLRAKKYLKDFLTNYMKKDGTIHAGKYNILRTEREALNFGWLIEEKVKNPEKEKFCFMHWLKNYKPRKAETELRQKEIEKERLKSNEEIDKMGFKKYLKLVYD